MADARCSSTPATSCAACRRSRPFIEKYYLNCKARGGERRPPLRRVPLRGGQEGAHRLPGDAVRRRGMRRPMVVARSPHPGAAAWPRAACIADGAQSAPPDIPFVLETRITTRTRRASELHRLRPARVPVPADAGRPDEDHAREPEGSCRRNRWTRSTPASGRADPRRRLSGAFFFPQGEGGTRASAEIVGGIMGRRVNQDLRSARAHRGASLEGEGRSIATSGAAQHDRRTARRSRR